MKIKDDKILMAILLKKDKPRELKNDEISDGIHIHYPNLILGPEERFLVYDKIISKIYGDKIFENKKKYFTNDYDNFIDQCTIKSSTWFMYGSGKILNGIISAYRVKTIYTKDCLIIENEYTNKELVKLLSLRNKKDCKVTKINSSYKEELLTIKEKYLKKSKVSLEDLFINKNNDDKKENNKNEVKNYKNNSSEIEEAKKLVLLLSKERSKNYETWISVGWALFNISPQLLESFKEFSKKSKEKYEEGCCERVWTDCLRRNIRSGYKIASLHRWAREDNAVGYDEYKLSKINKILDEGDIKADFDIATIIYEYYKHDFVCVDLDKMIWYQFNNNNWRIIQKAFGLSLKISKELPVEFAKLYSKYIILGTTTENQDKDKYMTKAQNINGLIRNLKNKTFKDRIISEAANLFYNENFFKNLDQNPYLVGFNNGVFELLTNKFRKGEPEDLVSITTGYDFKEFKMEDKEVQEVEQFYCKIQQDDEVRLLLQCYTASFFEGGNKDQRMVLLIGVGSNGKGTYIDLVDGTLGQYYGTIASTVFTQKRGNSSNATPELADKFNIRALGFQEIDSDDKFHVGFFKSITGQDKIQARPLYGPCFYYVPLFKLMGAMNNEPTIESDDNGTWRRILKIDFGTVFTKNPKKPNEVKGDANIREKIKNWYQAHSWLLLTKYYKIYKDNGGLDKLIPESVQLSTNKFKNDSNIFLEFLEEVIIKDDTSKLEKSQAWNSFKTWYIECYNSKSNSSQKKLIKSFETNGFKVDKGASGFIHGIRLKDEIDNF